MNVLSDTRKPFHNNSIIQSKKMIIRKYITKLYVDKVLFVLGCQRSGTTLLFMLLSSHPSIIGYNEDELNFSFPDLKVMLRSVKFTFNRDRYICYKLPTKTPELGIFQDIYKDAAILWIIRHPHSVISSMRSLIMPNSTENWLRLYGKMELKKHSRMFPEISNINFQKIDEITLGAYIYRYKVMAVEKYQEAKLNIYYVKFEDLVRNVKETLGPILVQIGVGWNESVLLHHEQHNGKIYCGKNIGSKPVDRSRMKPKLNLNHKEIEKINAICGEYIQKYYLDDL